MNGENKKLWTVVRITPSTPAPMPREDVELWVRLRNEGGTECTLTHPIWTDRELHAGDDVWVREPAPDEHGVAPRIHSLVKAPAPRVIPGSR